MIKLVVFDLDDTLISEQEYINSGYKVVAKELKKIYNLETDEKGIFNDLKLEFKKDSKNVFNRVLDNYNIQYTTEDILKLVKIYREHKPTINFGHDVIPTIKYLKNLNLKLGIITDGYIETQKAKLEVLGAYEIFDKIIMTEELGREYWKPHPKAFEMMKEHFNVDYSEIMCIGDNPKKDFFIASIYPICTVRVVKDDGVYGNEEYFREVKPNYIIKNLKEIKNIINILSQKGEIS